MVAQKLERKRSDFFQLLYMKLKFLVSIVREDEILQKIKNPKKLEPRIYMYLNFNIVF